MGFMMFFLYEVKFEPQLTSINRILYIYFVVKMVKKEIFVLILTVNFDFTLAFSILAGFHSDV